jgi:hypothetical protein
MKPKYELQPHKRFKFGDFGPDELKDQRRLADDELSPRQRWNQYEKDVEGMDAELEDLSFVEDRELFHKAVRHDLARVEVSSRESPADKRLNAEDRHKQITALKSQLDQLPQIEEDNRQPQLPGFRDQ